MTKVIYKNNFHISAFSLTINLYLIWSWTISISSLITPRRTRPWSGVPPFIPSVSTSAGWRTPLAIPISVTSSSRSRSGISVITILNCKRTSHKRIEIHLFYYAEVILRVVQCCDKLSNNLQLDHSHHTWVPCHILGPRCCLSLCILLDFPRSPRLWTRSFVHLEFRLCFRNQGRDGEGDACIYMVAESFCSDSEALIEWIMICNSLMRLSDQVELNPSHNKNIKAAEF